TSRRRGRKSLLRVEDLDTIDGQTIDDIDAPVKQSGYGIATDSAASDVLEDIARGQIDDRVRTSRKIRGEHEGGIGRGQGSERRRGLGFPRDWRQPHGVMCAIDFTGIARELCADLGTAAGGKGTLVELKAARANGDRPTRRAA